jgi:hypothetical protein
MRSNTRWWILTPFSAGCLCMCLGASVIALDLFGWRSTPAPAAATLSTSPTAPPDTAVATAVEPPPEAAGLSAEWRTEMDEIQAQVALLRGLRATSPVARTLLTSEELRQRVVNELLADYSQEAAEDDVRLLVLHGLLPSGFDLWGFYTDLYAEQVAGYYDQDAHQMVVVQGAGFEGPERLTYAHEYAHALQDQTFDFEGALGLSDQACEQDSERCAALRALIEGDATLVETQWLRTYATPDDLLQLQAFVRVFDSPVLYSAPPYLQEDFLFPYAFGVEFVRSLYLDGSWAAIDAAFADPPLSTEQILHPDRYPEDPPVYLDPPDVLDRLGSDWHEFDRGVMGEWFTLLVLSAQLPADQAAVGAEGWGGDYYLAFHNDRTARGALIWLSHWDTLRQAEEAFRSLREYGDLRFGEHATRATYSVEWTDGQDFILLERESQQTLWVLAPDESAARALRQGVPFPAPIP